MNDLLQEWVDNYYLDNNKRPCCAGCDYWRFFNSTHGECTKSAPVPSSERLTLLGVESVTMPPAAGHIITKRDYSCGDFVDTYDWDSHSK